jgi:hypothetical protein
MVEFAQVIAKISKIQYLDSNDIEKLLIKWYTLKTISHNEIHNSEIGKKFKLAEADQISQDFEDMCGYYGL